MKSSKLLNLINKLDQEILYNYTKIGQKLTDNKLYFITTALNLSSFEGIAFFGCHYGLSYLSSGLFTSGIVVPDLLYNVQALSGEAKDSIIDGEIIKNPLIEYKKKYNHLIRFPIFLLGASLTAFGIYDVINAYIKASPIDLNIMNNLWPGFSFLNLASSMYLKDKNPKILDKKPLFKRVYELIKDTFHLNERIRSPIPQTYSQNKKRLEDYL